MIMIMSNPSYEMQKGILLFDTEISGFAFFNIFMTIKIVVNVCRLYGMNSSMLCCVVYLNKVQLYTVSVVHTLYKCMVVHQDSAVFSLPQCKLPSFIYTASCTPQYSLYR